MTGLRPGGLALLLTTTWDLPLNVGKSVTTEFLLDTGDVVRGMDGRWLTNLTASPMWYITGDIWQSNNVGDIWYGYALVDARSLLPIDGETFNEEAGTYNSGRMVVVRSLPQKPRRMLSLPPRPEPRPGRRSGGNGPFKKGRRQNPRE